MTPTRHARWPSALATAIALAACTAQPTPPPAAPAPATPATPAPATPPPVAATESAQPVLGPQPVRAWGTGPDGSALAPMDEAHAPLAAEGGIDDPAAQVA